MYYICDKIKNMNIEVFIKKFVVVVTLVAYCVMILHIFTTNVGFTDEMSKAVNFFIRMNAALFYTILCAMALYEYENLEYFKLKYKIMVPINMGVLILFLISMSISTLIPYPC